MSDYFDSTQNRISDGLTARAADVNGLRDEVGVALDMLPAPDLIDSGTVNYAVDSGAADAYVVAMPQTATSYMDGMLVAFKPTNTNTGAATINVDDLGVKSIRRTTGSDALSAGDITAGIPVELRYSTTTGFFHLSWRTGNAGSYTFTGNVTFL